MSKINIGKLVTVEVKTEEYMKDLQKAFEYTVQNKLDTTANLYGYDTIMTAVSYAEETSVEKFQKDGKAFRKWRSLVWDYAYKYLNDVNQGLKAVPLMDDFVKSLPVLEL